MGFEEDFAKYMGQPSIQKQLKQHYKNTGGSVEGANQAIMYAQRAVAAIIASLPSSLTTGSNRPITTTDLVIDTPTLNSNGDYEIKLTWNPNAVHRYSLYEDGYSGGVENIVKLFSTGTKPLSHWVSGAYKKRGATLYSWYYIPEGWRRSADPFLRDAISAFNAEHSKNGVVLIAPPGYY